MTATQHQRGHKIYYHNGAWKYIETSEPIQYEKACVKCGHLPTKDGHDHCLGYINPGRYGQVVAACCGHGKHRAYIKLNYHQNYYKKLGE